MSNTPHAFPVDDRHSYGLLQVLCLCVLALTACGGPAAAVKPPTEPSPAHKQASRVLPAAMVPGAGAVLNPLVMVDGAAEFIAFVCAVFGVSENPDARAPLPNGKLIHAEVQMAGVNLMVFDQLEGWPARPGLLQVWVTDVAEVLAMATKHGATVITPAMPFYGDTTLGRMLDPWGNIWWLWAPVMGQADLPDDAKVFSTIDEALRALNKTP